MSRNGLLSSQKAFTLIEILIVIAIISILAAILFPVFARARENARRSSCMSNLKQIGLGMMMYTQDHDERFPPTIPGTWRKRPEDYIVNTDKSMPSGHFLINDQGASPQTKNFVTWMDLIFPYVKNVQVFKCPSHKASDTNPSYGYNTSLNTKPGTDGVGPAVGLSLAAINRPAEIVMNLDYPNLSGFSASANSYCDPSGGWRNPSNINYKSMWPHLEGGNVSFTDGHVKWHARESSDICIQTTPRTSHANQPNWNPGLN